MALPRRRGVFGFRNPSMAHAIVAAFVAKIAVSRTRSSHGDGANARRLERGVDSALPSCPSASGSGSGDLTRDLYSIGRHRHETSMPRGVANTLWAFYRPAASPVPRGSIR